MNIIMGLYLFILMAPILAQTSLMSMGFQMEFAQDNELIEAPYRLTPWVALGLPSGFYTKGLVALAQNTHISDEGTETVTYRSLGAELGFYVPLISLPYVYGTAQKISSLKNDRSGDRHWWEYGLGVGNKWRSVTGTALYGNIEYRFYEKHQINGNLNDQWIEGEGLMVALGFEWDLL